MNRTVHLPGIVWALIVTSTALACGDSDDEKDAAPKLVISGERVARGSGEADFILDLGEIEADKATMDSIVLTNAGGSILRVALDDAQLLPPWVSLEFDEVELKKGQKASVELSFYLPGQGAFGATLKFRTNEEKGVRTLRIHGDAVRKSKLSVRGDAQKVDPSTGADYAVDFGTIALGNPKALEVDVSNLSSEPLELEIQRVEESSDWLSFAPASFELAPDETKHVEVSVDPEIGGTFEAALELVVGGLPEARIRFQGVGVPLEVECDATADVGDVIVGEEGAAVFGCRNLSPLPVEILLGEFVGALKDRFSAEFAEGDPGMATLPEGESAEIVVTYSASSAGVVAVSLAVSDKNENVLKMVHVKANGIEP